LTDRALAIRHHTKIKKEVQFLVVTGDQGTILDDGGARTVLVPYIHEMGTALATADLVISRAGAATLAELAALRKRAIIVPWKDAAGDHQTANAQQLVQSGRCFSILPESQLSPDKLVEAVTESLHKTTVSSSSQRQNVARNGDQALIHILHEVLLDAQSADDTATLYRYRWRWHERFGESLP
jgi:UDP-N-acetylglucosamine--N-acetylmuramyl-(pentapeptide) pyrophosphoryl-undecaprenol N-acetylglucosamine transferase